MLRFGLPDIVDCYCVIYLYIVLIDLVITEFHFPNREIPTTLSTVQAYVAPSKSSQSFLISLYKLQMHHEVRERKGQGLVQGEGKGERIGVRR